MGQDHAPLPDPGARGVAHAYALVRTQDRTIAIPGECVIQALPAPAELAQLPRRVGGIEGVMKFGSRVLPVISLARWLEPAAALDLADGAGNERPRGAVLVLRDGEGCIGLAVEAVVGVQRIAAAGVRRLFHDDRPDELFQSAAMFCDDTVPTSVLEPRRLMALAGVWAAEADLAGAGDALEATAEGTGSAVESAAAAASARPVAYATFRIADAHVALPAANIGELLRCLPLRHELPERDGIRGLCEWRGRLVPVVDLVGALEALPADAEAPWLCILCEGDLAIGILLHEVLQIAKIAPNAGTPEHAPASQRSVVARRALTGDRMLHVIDVSALLRRYAETAISRPGARVAEQQRRTDDSVAPAYMVFDAGGLFAAPIDGVQEVVPIPAELRARLDAGVSATLQWRQHPVPVMAIADSRVTLPAGAARQLVIIRQGDRLAALAISGVSGLVPRGMAQRNRMRLHGRPSEVISVVTKDHRASYAVVDLGMALRPAA